jgi:pimeloyl-ACP methyl ester carboxylesterase
MCHVVRRIVISTSLIVIFLLRVQCSVSAQGFGNSGTQPPWIRKQGDTHAQGVIVFVHGVLGNARTTWLNGSSYWPEMLTRDKTFDGQDIYVYDYQSPRLHKTFSIDEVADNLRLVLSTDGVLRYKEMTFVSHSMGGIITRAFLLRYHSQVVPKVRFLYFFATPTTGSPYATLAAVVSKNPQFAQMYPMNQPDSYLGPLQANWLAAAFHLKSYCAYETQSIFGEIIVGKDSATHLCTERTDPIDADHITIVKPRDTTSTAYRALQSAFQETASTHGPPSPRPSPRPLAKQPSPTPQLKPVALVPVFFDKKDLCFLLLNTGDVVANEPKFTIGLGNLSRPYYASYQRGSPPEVDPLPIPTQKVDDYVRPHEFLEKFKVLNDLSLPYVKDEDRLFGEFLITCRECPAQRAYWLYWKVGEGGWYAEISASGSRSIPFIKLPHMSDDEITKAIDILVPDQGRIAFLSNEEVSRQRR